MNKKFIPRKKGHLRSLIFWVCLPFLASNAVYADFYLHPWEDHHELPLQWRIRLDSTYYSTAQNYSARGEVIDLTQNSQNHSTFRNQNDLNLQLGLTESFTLYGRAAWALVSSGSSSFSRNSYGFADQSIGMNARIYQNSAKTLAINFQTQVDFPVYNNSKLFAMGAPPLGDESTDVSFGIFVDSEWFHSHSRDLKANFGLAYLYRSSFFSSAIPWSFSTLYLPRHQGVLFGILGNGFGSLNTDARSYTTPISASYESAITNGINPSLAQVGGQFGYQWSQLTRISLTGMRSVWGQNQPVGLSILLQLQTHLGSPSQSAEVESSPPLTQSPEKFREFTLEAKVIRTNDRLNLVKINKGSQDGIMVGQFFEIFSMKPNGSADEGVARAEVTHVKSAEAALIIREYYKEVWIDEGFVAKRLAE